MELKMIKDSEMIVNSERCISYKKIYYRFNDIVTSILNNRVVYQVYCNKDYCDVVVSYGNYKLPIKRFASNDHEYNRICAEELVELLNQKQ